MADLTVTITESVTLNGGARGSTNTLTVAGVDDVYHRIITVPASADSELTLRRAEQQELIKYSPGSEQFEIIHSEKLNDKEILLSLDRFLVTECSNTAGNIRNMFCSGWNLTVCGLN